MIPVDTPMLSSLTVVLMEESHSCYTMSHPTTDGNSKVMKWLDCTLQKRRRDEVTRSFISALEIDGGGMQRKLLTK